MVSGVEATLRGGSHADRHRLHQHSPCAAPQPSAACWSAAMLQSDSPASTTSVPSARAAGLAAPVALQVRSPLCETTRGTGPETRSPRHPAGTWPPRPRRHPKRSRGRRSAAYRREELQVPVFFSTFLCDSPRASPLTCPCRPGSMSVGAPSPLSGPRPPGAGFVVPGPGAGCGAGGAASAPAGHPRASSSQFRRHFRDSAQDLDSHASETRRLKPRAASWPSLRSRCP